MRPFESTAKVDWKCKILIQLLFIVQGRGGVKKNGGLLGCCIQGSLSSDLRMPEVYE